MLGHAGAPLPAPGSVEVPVLADVCAQVLGTSHSQGITIAPQNAPCLANGLHECRQLRSREESAAPASPISFPE